MIYSYENDVFGATLSTVFKLEEFLDESLARQIDVFEIPDLPDREESFERQKPGVFLKLEEIGFEIHPMKKAFFDAITRGEEDSMITKVEKKPKKTLKEIKVIKEVSHLASCNAFIITDFPNPETNVEFLETLDERRPN
jgi:predicted transcriptional regulator